MTQPFQYNNFVQSQIAVGPAYISSNYGAQPQSNNYLETSNGNQSRLQLKQKINELLGLCKEENEGIKNQFAQVMGAEREILDLMKQQIEQPPRFNNYARSNVEMFPGTQQAGTGITYAPGSRYQQDQKPRSYQSFPVYKNAYQGGNQNIPITNNAARSPQQYYEPADTGAYRGNGNGQTQAQGIFPSQQYIQPARYQGNAPSQQNVRYASQENPDYSTPYPQGGQGGQGNYGFDSGHYPSDRANILKSKVHELRQENNRLRGLAEQVNPKDEDDETRYLQQQIGRLRAVVQDYESQLNAINNSQRNDKRGYLLRQLKDQGEKIRQDTLTFLRNKSSPSSGFIGNNMGSNGQQAPQMISSGYRGGSQSLHPDQHALLRSQLNELKVECEQLHSENANIKRMSKGTNFTSGSRKF